MTRHTTTRRSFLAATTALGAALPFAAAARAAVQDAGGPFRFEIVRSEAEWRAMLSEQEYEILREKGTEWPGSSALWDDYSAGEFTCRGCDLHVYSSRHRAPIDKGWVFFYHAIPQSVLTGIDTASAYSMSADDDRTLIEVHCRRCGSHMGHILRVDAEVVHCINGTSLVFHAAAG